MSLVPMSIPLLKRSHQSNQGILWMMYSLGIYSHLVLISISVAICKIIAIIPATQISTRTLKFEITMRQFQISMDKLHRGLWFLIKTLMPKWMASLREQLWSTWILILLCKNSKIKVMSSMKLQQVLIN